MPGLVLLLVAVAVAEQVWSRLGRREATGDSAPPHGRIDLDSGVALLDVPPR